MSIYSNSSTPLPLGVTMAPDGSTLFNQYSAPTLSPSQQNFQEMTQFNYENFMTDDSNAPLETISDLMPMQRKSVKIFNFGLPRSGTTSFHLFMKENGYKTVHTNDGFINKCFPTDYFEFIQDSNNLDNNLIEKYISDNEVFSDLPWYSYKLRKKIIEKYKNNPNVYFVATTRKKEDWIRSIKTIIPHIKSESEKQFH